MRTLAEHGIAIPPGDLRYTCESTGQYHMPLCLAWRGHPAIINPSDTAPVRRKADRLDAEELAQHGSHGSWRESRMAPDEIQGLRVLVLHRSKLAAERRRLTHRINSDPLRFGHVVGQLGKINGPVVRPLIEDFCTHGTVGLHRDLFSDIRIPPGVALVIDRRWERVVVLDREIRRIGAMGTERVGASTWRIGGGGTAAGRPLRADLEGIPGVGPRTAITRLAGVGEITRFSSVNERLAYAGLDPSDRVSAGKVTGTRTREGNARLHGALRNAARAMLGPAPSCRSSIWARADMARQSRGGRSKAIRAPARRIGKALYYCHPRDGPFDESGYRAPLLESGYPLCPVEEMGPSAGVVRNLEGQGLQTSRQVVAAFYSDLGERPGCGRVTILAVAAWIHSHRDRGRDRPRRAEGPEGSGGRPTPEGCDSGGS
jgi:transposase